MWDGTQPAHTHPSWSLKASGDSRKSHVTSGIEKSRENARHLTWDRSLAKKSASVPGMASSSVSQRSPTRNSRM